MNPIHIYISVALIVATLIAAPFAYDYLREVYPEGELGYIYDKCEAEQASFDRWDEGARALCRVMNRR